MAQEQASPTPAEVYEQVLVPAMFVPCTRLLLAHAQARPSAHVLDLACGSGVVARTVAPVVGPAGRVVGVDLRPGMLAVAAALPAAAGAPVEWREGDATALDLADGSFDLVLCQQGLQFFPDRPAALSEIRRVLKKGGRVAFALWQGRERQNVFDAMCEVEIRHLAPLGVTREDVEAFVSLGDAGEILDLLRDAGFRDVDVVEESIDADFDAATFVRDAEYAYSAFMPQFRENPAAFDAYLATVARELEPVLAPYRKGSRLIFPVPLNIATAVA